MHQVLTYSRRDNESILLRILPFGFLLFSRLSILVEHGRNYLSTEEYNRCLKHAEREYFVYLTKSACALRSQTQEFWEFHRNGLSALNYSLGWKILWKWIPRAVLEKAWDAFWRRWDKDSCPPSDLPSPIVE